MIAQLRGRIIEKQPPTLVIEVQGVGYLLQAPLTTFFALPVDTSDIVLYTHLVVREDAHLLFGFFTKEACHLFQTLIKLNGVGPKVALAILSSMTPQEFMHSVQMQASDRLHAIPGIGAKTASRILIEMQDKVPKFTALLSGSVSGVLDVRQEAIAALMALGYKSLEATKAVNKVKSTTHGCEAIIKEALSGFLI